FPALRNRVELVVELFPRFVPTVATAGTLAAGLILIGLARGLRRRKRRAWTAAVVLSAASAVLHLVKGLDVEETGLATAVLIALLATAGCFPAAADPVTRRGLVATLLTVPVSGILLGTAYLALRPHQLVDHPPWYYLVAEAATGLVGMDGPVDYRSTAAADHAAVLLGVLGLACLLTLLAVLLRPGRAPTLPGPQDNRRLRELVTRFGAQDSLGYFALRDDRLCTFSPTGKSAVTYRVLGGISLAAGDPIGDVEAWPGAIRSWLDEAEQHAWAPAVLGASERAAQVLTRYGFDALELGDEAIVDVAEFTLQGREVRSLRQAVNRIARTGTTLRVDRVAELSLAELGEVRHRAHEWRDGPTERGFSMALGRFGDPADGQCVLVRAHDADGVLSGLLHLVPWGPDGLSLDLMRRNRSTENGLVEFMVAGLVAAAPRIGVRRISLNFAVFRSVFARGERVGAGPVLRLWRQVLLLASRFWQIESLYRSNAKYRPIWEPRFLCFRQARDLPRIGLAALEAEAFLVRPRWLGGRPRALG
ncbi:MAG TPA: phosphatidylglycerol lysyltransferase domain-containing protein, partial [Pseudonocardiaceae bacterium]|nr:phosphatidylglycerol lysyltransferase domain-containing protein [Pseudonocardiaceae bacterium]